MVVLAQKQVQKMISSDQLLRKQGVRVLSLRRLLNLDFDTLIRQNQGFNEGHIIVIIILKYKLGGVGNNG